MIRQVGYLGPEETFTHLVAKKRFPSPQVELVPLSCISEVFSFVEEVPERIGIIPIENSSGGTIYETVDCLVRSKPTLKIIEEFSMKVNLALLARPGTQITVLYSHFAPLNHCEKWLKENLAGVKICPVVSTARAAEIASKEIGAAALATRDAAARYNLSIIKYPVQKDVTNITQFFAIGSPSHPSPRSTKTSLIARLNNSSGSLFSFLAPFQKNKVNLSRLLSRPIAGHPNTYVFFVDVEGTDKIASVKKALLQAQKVAQDLRCVGVYPVAKRYQS